jgi:hypothetical protein
VTLAADHRSTTELEAGLDHVRLAPADAGTVELIVTRPADAERAVLDEAVLDLELGVVGDNWSTRGSRMTADGSAEHERQITIMNARAATLIGGPDHGGLHGDQLYVDLDIGLANLPAGSRLALGTAVVEITEPPHTGCAKFSARFGVDALRFVNSPAGKELRIRGANARVVTPGVVRRGDTVTKLAR